MIKMQLIGNLGKDAESRDVNGKKVINFSVAHTEKVKDESKTIWVDCAYWTDKEGILPYLKKGQQVAVEGNPDIRKWEGGATLTLRVNSIQLLGGKQEASQQPQQQAAEVKEEEPNDLPF